MSSLALINGKVRTLHTGTPDGVAVLIEHGTVRLVGSSDDVLNHKKADTPVIDVAGRVVMPGMIDSHTHVEFSALSKEWLDVRGLSPTEAVNRLRHEIADGDVRGNRWVVAQGTFGQKLPTLADLDEVSREVPILVRESMHRLVANSAALDRAGLVRGATSPVGTLVEIGPDGEPTGAVDEGFHLFPVPAPSPERLRAMLHDELRNSFARHGVTCIYELPASSSGVNAYQHLNAAGALSTRLSLTLTVAPGLSPILSSTEQLAEIGLSNGFGDDCLWIGGIKLFLDGDDTSSFDSSHLTKSPSRWSTSTRQYAEIVHTLVSAHRAGLQVWIHAIGDLAQHLALDAIEESNRVAGDGDRRTRLEHVANLWVDESLVRRLKDLRVIPVPTAAFVHSDPGTGVYAYRTLIDAGLRPPGNSDNGGTQPFATNPWFGVGIMLDRINRGGITVAPQEAVDVDTAIRTYTEFAAHAGFQERRLGALGIGMFGDCAVYERDPRELSPAELRDLEADLTVVGGRPVWQKEGTPFLV